jgi:hypothetical protein
MFTTSNISNIHTGRVNTMSSSPLREQFPTLFDKNSRVEINLDIIRGWLTLVTGMLELLRQEQGNTPELRIIQIKVKFGQLRVYGDDFSERADAIVEEAEEKSATICDVCGAQGEPSINPSGTVVGVRCAKHIRKFEMLEAELSAAMRQAKVGIFFVVNGELVFDAVPLEQGHPYGDNVGFSGHYDYWEALAPKNPTEQLFKSHAYDYYPRGRVIYFNVSSSFRLYADRCMKKADIERVAATFQLPAYRLARDEHYQCAGCNSGYVDI